MPTLEVWAPAKLNLYLEILSRRPDGFHELDTVMTAISLYDTLSVRPHNEDILLTLRHSQANPTPNEIPTDESNLIVRAARLLREQSSSTNGISIELVKRIPSAAGLGGASSDAAATLLACNHLWNLGWSIERLAEIGADIGSDVPFFLYGGMASCRGRGEIIRPIHSSRRHHFVVAKPPVGLSTGNVYRKCHVPAEPQQRRESEVNGRIPFNRLQEAAEELTPWIARMNAAFEQAGARQHGMSGSGTSYFAICENAAEARYLSNHLRTKQLGRILSAHSHCRIRSRLREPSLN